MTEREEQLDAGLNRRGFLKIAGGAAVGVGLMRSGLAHAAGALERVEGKLSGTLTFGIRDYFKDQASQIVSAYERHRPGVSVKLQLLPTDVGYNQKVLAEKISGSLPDVLAIYDVVNDPFADAGITRDLAPLLTGPNGFPKGYFAERFLNQYRVTPGHKHAGEIHGLPQGADAVVLFYNKKHFKEAGIRYPNDSWTYGDLVKTARKLTKKNGSRTVRYGFVASYSWQAIYQALIESFGGRLVSKDGRTALINSPAALRAWHALLDPIKEGIFVPPDVQKTSGSDEGTFLNGTASMIPFVRALVPEFRSSIKNPWDVAQFPLVNGVRKVGSGSVGLAVTTSAKNVDLAYDFLKWYFSEQGGMRILAKSYAVVPPIPRLYNSPIWRALPPPPANNQVFAEAIAHGVLPGGLPFEVSGGFDDAVLRAEQEVLIKERSIEQAFGDANATITKALRH